MNRTFYFLLSLFLTTHSFAEQFFDPASSMATSEGICDSLIGGHVSAITGEFVDTAIDFILPGPEPLVLSRQYSGQQEAHGGYLLPDNSLASGWRYNHAAPLGLGHGHSYTMYYCPGGVFFPFKNRNCGSKRYTGSIESLRGMTNASSGLMSSATDAKNFKLVIGKSNATLQHPSGIIHHYKYEYKKLHQLLPEKCYVKFFLETDHVRQDGSSVEYAYDENLPSKIQAKNKDGSLLGAFNFSYAERAASQTKQIVDYTDTVQASNGQTCSFTYFPLESNKIRKTYVAYSHQPQLWYTHQNSYLIEKRWGDLNHYLKINYCPINKQKVTSLCSPWGAGGEEISVLRFEYGQNFTASFDVLNRRTHYEYDDKDRLTRIVKFAGSAQTEEHSIESFTWGAAGSPNESYLISRNITDRENKVYCQKDYSYDAKGNVTEELLKGNLTGKDQDEIYWTQRAFDNSLFSNLLFKSEANGRGEAYCYLANTNLVNAKFLYDQGVLVKREFTDFDPAISAATQIVVDDGHLQDKNSLQGVTERHITHYLYQKNNNVCLPHQIETRALDIKTGHELLLSKKIKTYLKTGQVSHESIFDQTDKLRYVLEWEYNEHGLEIRHVNALQQESFKKYDENDRLIEQGGPSRDLHFEYAYDLADRLISSTEVHHDGKTFTTSYKYDLVGNKIATTDFMGNETRYEYDEFNQLVKTIYCDGAEVSTLYNVMGQPIESTDELGFKTFTEYNLRGKPTKITHADGTLEQFEYYLDGNLKQSINSAGLITSYTWDCQGRNLSKEEITCEGTILSRTINTYNAFHLIQTEDIDGRIVEYQHDPFGRVICEKGPLYQTQYEYDALGNLEKTIKGQRATVQIHDLLGRVIEERIESLAGEIFTKKRFAFDEAGHCTHTWDGNDALTQTFFDPKGQPTLIIDALGNETHFEYGYAPNLVIIVTDAKGQKTVKTHDARGRVICDEKINSLGVLIAKQEMFYDLKGQKTSIIDHVLFNGEKLRTLTHQMSYNAAGQLTRWVEGAGEVNQKVTTHIYNQFGQKSETIKPNGTSLYYTYDERGALKDFFSSDKTFHVRYHYNSQLQPIAIEDLILHTKNTFEYNLEGQIIYEKLGNDLASSYEYDSFGQLTKISLPDASSINYAYSPFGIKSVERNQFRHTYNTFDGSGHLTEETLPNGEKVSYNYDLLGRLKNSTSKYFTETDFTYDAVGHLTHFSREDALGLLNNDYTYDELYQLSSERNHNYTHDSLNNRLSKDDAVYTINNLNQITRQGNTTYDYDQNGNITQKHTPEGSTSYTYDALDRLIKVTTPTNNTTYTYDAFNRRLTANDKRFLYHDQNEIGCFNNNELTELRLLGIGQGAEIGAAVAFILNGQNHIPLHDHNGHVIGSISPENQITTIRYTAFGEEETPSNNLPWRFSSKRFDSETGFTYFGQRYYDASIGRWITTDPIGLEDGPNMYAFLKNDPLLTTDLYGLYTNHDKVNSDREFFDLPTGYNNRNSGSRSRDLERTDFRSELKMNSQENNRYNQDIRNFSLYDSDWGSHNPSYQYFGTKNSFETSYWESFCKGLSGEFSDKICDLNGRIRGFNKILEQSLHKTAYLSGYLTSFALSLFALEPAIGYVAKLPICKNLFAGIRNKLYTIMPNAVRWHTQYSSKSGSVIHVTPQGVALPPIEKYRLPSWLKECKFREGRYGVYDKKGFKEILRIDQATVKGAKGPNFSHYHRNNTGKHYVPKNTDPGFWFD